MIPLALEIWTCSPFPSTLGKKAGSWSFQKKTENNIHSSLGEDNPVKISKFLGRYSHFIEPSYHKCHIC